MPKIKLKIYKQKCIIISLSGQMNYPRFSSLIDLLLRPNPIIIDQGPNSGPVGSSRCPPHQPSLQTVWSQLIQCQGEREDWQRLMVATRSVQALIPIWPKNLLHANYIGSEISKFIF